ncbi:pyrimidine utilization protein D [Rosenbergiella nectarea]|uniref:pyrimidine utilization protein D n=1 Tax=Rosenbergiella nectarea TaxID=988801 RepID=UPI001F4DF6D8|nr:pyrimidine utilization protein D [Rosenbergiella nectarea]
MTFPIAYRVSGREGPEVSTVVLSSGLGGVGNFWQPQLASLERYYRVIVYDQRGTGGSPAQLPDDYSMAMMAQDVVLLLDHLAIQRCHFVGHALGGIIGLTLAELYPQRLLTLVVINGWAALNPHTQRCFEVRRNLLSISVDAYLQAQPCFLYPADWLAQHEQQIAAEEAFQRQHFQGQHNLLRRLEALMAVDLKASLGQITLPCLVICTKDDLLVPWMCSLQLAERLVNSRYIALDYGGHAMTVTDPIPFTEQLIQWLET